MMKRLAFILLLALQACTSITPQGAVAADAASTAAALSSLSTVAEANPLGWVTVPIRLIAIEHAKTMPAKEGRQLTDAVTSVSVGAALNNVVIALGGPLGPVIGVAAGLAQWISGAEEREFLRLCEVHHRMDERQLPCVYKKT